MTTDMEDGKRWTIKAFDTSKTNKKETPSMVESRVIKNFEGTPFCPDCNVGLDFMPSNGRDTETMGGESVEYAKCEKCNQEFEIIGDEIYSTGPQS